MDIYLDNPNKNVLRTDEAHILICTKIPDLLEKRTNLRRYAIKGSDGVGQRTFYPWICLMDRNITLSPQKGFYIAILFQRNMKGFYVTLNQGITYFRETYASKAYERANEMARYFREQIDDNQYDERINLGGIKPDNGYGFEQTTIIAKHFDKNHFTDEQVFACLDSMAAIYDEIIETIDANSYEAIVPKIIYDRQRQFQKAEKAIDEIQNVVFQGIKAPVQIPVEVTPRIDVPKRFKRISTPSNRKIDYVKRAAENAQTGLLGESLMLRFEIERLNRLGLEEYAEKVEHVSLENDVLGYDIESYDIDTEGHVTKIFIEVKTAATEKDGDFFVSRNEVERSKELCAQYWVYRVYNCRLSSSSPKFYRVQGSIEDNFALEPETFKATLKKDARIVSSDCQVNRKMIQDIKESLSTSTKSN
ncbi:MAG: DUF3578 domain-containing protein [Bacilli bacterium]